MRHLEVSHVLLFVILTKDRPVPKPQEQYPRALRRVYEAELEKNHPTETLLGSRFCLGGHFVSVWPQSSQLLLVSLVLKCIKFRRH